MHNHHYEANTGWRGPSGRLTPDLTPPARSYGSVRSGVRPSSLVSGPGAGSYTPSPRARIAPDPGGVRTLGPAVRSRLRGHSEASGLNLLPYPDSSDYPRAGQATIAALGNGHRASWELLTRPVPAPPAARRAQPRPIRPRRLAAAGLATAAGAALAVEVPVDMAIAVRHLVAQPASPLAAVALLLAVLRLGRLHR